MAKLVINKHIDDKAIIDRGHFTTDVELAKGEIVICNDTAEPALYIINNEEELINVTQKTEVDLVLNSESSNPIANKAVNEALDAKQERLISGTNIKTINGMDIIGGGDIVISSEGAIAIDDNLNDASVNPVQNRVIYQALESKIDSTDLSDVALSGDYNDLTNLPVFKTFNNQPITGEGNIEVSTVYESNIGDPDLTTVEDFGDIKAGTKLSAINGKTYNELFDNILFPTVNPTYTQPSVTFKLKNYNDLVVAGSYAPSLDNFTRIFDRGAIMLNGTKQNDRAGELDTAQSFMYYNNNIINVVLPLTVPLGPISYHWMAYYKQGPQPFNNKGGIEGLEPLPAGSKKSLAINIYGTLPFFATTSENKPNQPIEQELIRWTNGSGTMESKEFTLIPTDFSQQIISTPRPITNLYIQDPNSGNFIESSLDNFVLSEEVKIINDIDRDYYTYTYNGAGRSYITLKIKF